MEIPSFGCCALSQTVYLEVGSTFLAGQLGNVFDVGGKGQFLDAGGLLPCLPSLPRNPVAEAKF